MTVEPHVDVTGGRRPERFEQFGQEPVGAAGLLGALPVGRAGVGLALLGGSDGAHRATAARASFIAASTASAPVQAGRRSTRGIRGVAKGAAVVASLPAAGIRPRALILLDPPYLALDGMVAMTRDPIEHRYDSVEEALANLQAANLGWTDGDLEAKALALTRFDPEAASAVLSRNGDWDAGLAALSHPNAARIPVWILRGEPRSGCLIPDEVVPALAARVGADHVLTIEHASHSPMRTRDPAAVTLAILQALGWQSVPTSGT